MRRGWIAMLCAAGLLAGCAALDEPAPVTGPGEPGFVGTPGYAVGVGPGDTLGAIAQRYNMSTEALARANHLKPPYIIQVGQVLVIPPPATYKVRRDDTVEGIARMYGVSEVALARANGLTQPYSMKVGQVLKMPGGVGGDGPALAETAPEEALATETAVPKSAISGGPLAPPAGAAASAAPPVAAAPAPPVRTAQTARETAQAAGASPTALAPQMGARPEQAPPPVAAPQQVASAAPLPAPVAPASPAAGAPHFLTPVKGQVISNYGGDANGQKNDGINIAAAAGTPVQAADAGTVVYAGNELAGFGNLVLIRHTGGFVTAYGHLASISVQRGATVARAQAIGTVGQTGSVTSPQLHFEVRQGSKPVDPTPYLAGKS